MTFFFVFTFDISVCSMYSITMTMIANIDNVNIYNLIHEEIDNLILLK